MHGAVFLFPIPLANFMPDEQGLITLATGWIAVFVLEMLLYAVGTAFIVLILTKERTLRMHKTAALTDPLTGLFNRRGLIEAARELTGKHARRTQPLAVLVFDLDHFKTINDRFGHAVGDDVLKLFAALASGSMRTSDFVARLGGEEFAVIIRGTLDEGIAVAERLRVAFEDAARTVSGRYVGATVSVGVAAHAAHHQYRRADRARRRGALCRQGGRPQPGRSRDGARRSAPPPTRRRLPATPSAGRAIAGLGGIARPWPSVGARRQQKGGQNARPSS